MFSTNWWNINGVPAMAIFSSRKLRRDLFLHRYIHTITAELRIIISKARLHAIIIDAINHF